MKNSELKKYINSFPDDVPVSVICANPRNRKYGEFEIMKQIEQTLDSREVAEMVGKQHKNLLEDVQGYVKELGELKIQPTDFFRENTYKTEQNKTLPCYDISKTGWNSWKTWREVDIRSLEKIETVKYNKRIPAFRMMQVGILRNIIQFVEIYFW